MKKVATLQTFQSPDGCVELERIFFPKEAAAVNSIKQPTLYLG